MIKVEAKNEIKKLFIYFMLYSIFGWIYEVFLEVVIYKWGFSNRGVLFGPYCPVYGVGALAFLFLIYPFIKNKTLKYKLILLPFVFLGCMTVATIIELITSYMCEAIMGYWPWQTYADYKINFQGRIALSPSIRFGIGGVVFLYIFQPFFEFIFNKVSSKILNIVFWVLLICIVADLIGKIILLII